MITYRQCDERAERIRNAVVVLGSHVASMLTVALTVLDNSGSEAATEICRGDDTADAMHQAIHADCAHYVAGASPLAKDLCFIVTALQVATDLERIADQAVEVAITGKSEAPLEADWPMGAVSELGAAVERMVQDSVSAFAVGNVSLARQLRRADDAVDARFRDLVHELTEMIGRHSERAHIGVRLVMAIQALERAADHAADIADWVIFSETGERAVPRLLSSTPPYAEPAGHTFQARRVWSAADSAALD